VNLWSRNDVGLRFPIVKEQDAPIVPRRNCRDIDNGNPLVAEKQFGPALPIIRYETVDEAVAMANALDVGLGASVWSTNLAAARDIAARLEAGTCWINKNDAVDPRIPFDGSKQSGYGLEFGVEGLTAVGRAAGDQRLAMEPDPEESLRPDYQ
jgi:delta 1-pyrroline-5-carboxylate dehydrogenase